MKSRGQRAPARGFLIPFHFYYGREEEGRGRLSPPGAGDNIVERVSYRQHRDRFYGETPNPTTKDDSVFPLRRAGKLAAFHFRGMNFARQVSFSIFFLRMNTSYLRGRNISLTNINMGCVYPQDHQSLVAISLKRNLKLESQRENLDRYIELCNSCL